MSANNDNSATCLGFGLLLWFIITFIYTNHYSQDKLKAENLLENAELQLSSGKLENVSALLEEIKVLKYCHSPCLHIWGKLRNKEEKFEEGRQLCVEAMPVTHNPSCSSAPILQCQATSELGLHNFVAAATLLETVLKCDNSTVHDIAFHQLAHAYHELNLPDQLLHLTAQYAEYRSIEVQQADNALACSYASDLLPQNHQLQQVDKAFRYITHRLETEEHAAGVCLLRSFHRVLMTKQQFANALEVSKQMVKLTQSDKHNAEGQKLMGESLLAMNHIGTALSVLTLAHGIDENDAEILFLLARGFELGGDENRSEFFLSSAVQQMGDKALRSDIFSLGKLQLRMGLWEKALVSLSRSLDMCLEEFPDQHSECSGNYLSLGKVQHRLGLVQDALKSYYRAADNPLFEAEALTELYDIANSHPPAAISGNDVFSTPFVEDADGGAEDDVSTISIVDGVLTVSLPAPTTTAAATASPSNQEGGNTAVHSAPNSAAHIRDVLITRDAAETSPQVPTQQQAKQQLSQTTASVQPVSQSAPIAQPPTWQTTNTLPPAEKSAPSSVPAVKGAEKTSGKATPATQDTVAETGTKTVKPATGAASTSGSRAADVNVKAESYLKIARYFLDKNLPELALKEVAKAVRKAPKYAESYLVRAAAYKALGAHDKVVSDFIYVCNELKSDSVAVVQAISQYMTEVGSSVSSGGIASDAAAVTITQLHEMIQSSLHFGVSEHMTTVLVKAYSALENYSSAIAVFDRFIAHEHAHLQQAQTTTEDNSNINNKSKIAIPSTRASVALYADLLERAKDLQKAEAVWEIAVEGQLATWTELGDFFSRQSNFVAAVQCFEKQLDLLTEQQHKAADQTTTIVDARTGESHLPESGSASSEDSKSLQLDIAAVHKRIGATYAELSTARDDTAVQRKPPTGTVSASDQTHEQESPVEQTYLSKANAHYEAAMLLGAYDLEMRRFFANNPLPAAALSRRRSDNHDNQIVGSGGVGGQRSGTIGGNDDSYSSDNNLLLKNDNESIETELSSPAAAALTTAGKLHSRHRWVVRHIITAEEQRQMEEAETSLPARSSHREGFEEPFPGSGVELDSDADSKDEAAERTNDDEDENDGAADGAAMTDFERQRRAREKESKRKSATTSANSAEK